MTAAAAIAACVLLGALAVFQALLACRLPLGRFAWGGQHEVLPTRLRVGSVAAIAVYVVIGWVVLARAGLLGGGPATQPRAATVAVRKQSTTATGVITRRSARLREARLPAAPRRK